LEASLPAGGGAHRAGFEGHIQRAVFETPIVDDFPGRAQSKEFRVSGWVGQLPALIPGAGDDLPSSSDHRAHRDFSPRRGRNRLLKRFCHGRAIVVIEDP
jgi:hypothetical protein